MRFNPASAKARIVTDGCRALVLRCRVGRTGNGGYECGSGAGRIPRHPSGRHVSQGDGSEQEKRDPQEKTGIVASPRQSGRSIDPRQSIRMHGDAIAIKKTGIRAVALKTTKARSRPRQMGVMVAAPAASPPSPPPPSPGERRPETDSRASPCPECCHHPLDDSGRIARADARNASAGHALPSAVARSSPRRSTRSTTTGKAAYSTPISRRRIAATTLYVRGQFSLHSAREFNRTASPRVTGHHW